MNIIRMFERPNSKKAGVSLVLAIAFSVIGLIIVSTKSQANQQSVDASLMQYAEAYNVSVDEARERLALQARISQDLQIIENRYRGQFVTATFHHTPEFGVTVKELSNAGLVKRSVSAYRWSEYAEVTSFRGDLNTLNRVHETILDNLMDAEGDFISSISLDYDKEAILIKTNNVSEMKKLALSSFSNGMKRQIDRDSLIVWSEDLELQPVKPFTHPAGESLGGCTSGPNVKYDGKKYATTAGHCPDHYFGGVAHNYQYNPWNSSRSDNRNHRGQDYQIHELPQDELKNELLEGNHREKVVGYGNPYNGLYVCMNGETSGISCGTVTSTNASLDTGTTTLYGFAQVTALPPRSHFGCQGDSGALLYQPFGNSGDDNNIARGMVSGGEDVCHIVGLIAPILKQPKLYPLSADHQ